MTPSHNATQASRHVAKFNGSQVDMPEVSSRELSCKHSQTIRRASTSRARNLVQRPSCPIRGSSGGRQERQETRPEAVLGARRLVRRPSWPPRGSSGGRQERQEARLEAILNAMRPVERPSWTPGGSSAGRLGRQEARMQVLLQFLQQNAGFAQAAVWGVRLQSSKAAKPHCGIFV